MTLGSVFSGIGGFEVGAEMEGIETLFMCEADSWRQNILRQHFPKIKIYGNITKIIDPPQVDILCGGFPCQDISSAGIGTGIFGYRSFLYTEMFRVASILRPPYIVFENSPQLCRKGLEYILYDLSKIGYDAEWEYIQADWFGYRHKRTRLIIIAYPMQERCEGREHIFQSVCEGNNQWQSGKTELSSKIERFNRHTVHRTTRGNAGFSIGLDKNAVAAIGDSVNTSVSRYIFSCIKAHNQPCS